MDERPFNRPRRGEMACGVSRVTEGSPGAQRLEHPSTTSLRVAVPLPVPGRIFSAR